MVCVGANDGVVVLRRCLEIEEKIGGESNTGRAIVSPDVLVTKQLRQFSIYCITRKSAESARMKKYSVETHCSSLMREKPLSESSAVVMIKSCFFFFFNGNSREGPADFYARVPRKRPSNSDKIRHKFAG